MKKFLNTTKVDTSQDIEMVDFSSHTAPIPNLDPAIYTFEFKLPDFKLNLNAGKMMPLFKLKKIRSDFNFSMAASLAHTEYLLQPENKKLEPINRFWPKPRNLQERAIQVIAAQEIKTGQLSPGSEILPQHLRQDKDKLLNDFKSEAGRERLALLLNILPPPPREVFIASLAS